MKLNLSRDLFAPMQLSVHSHHRIREKYLNTTEKPNNVAWNIDSSVIFRFEYIVIVQQREPSSITIWIESRKCLGW